MPSILSDEDKQIVKRTVPKAANKIHAVAVAKLYIAYPNHQRWTYTGLQGAAVLANDLVGNTFWVKLVDVSPANRGVIWDQEIYDTFNYNQDRTFFHSFEGEECMFGLSFADEKEAKQFLKKMAEREKNAHKNTKARPFASGPAQSGQGIQQAAPTAGKSHGRFGGLFSHKSGNSSQQSPAQSIIPPRGVEIHAHTPASGPASPAFSTPSSEIDLSDPAVQKVLVELQGLGITEDQIEANKGFILSYLEQSKATARVEAEKKERAARAPPPPPPRSSPNANAGAFADGPPVPPPLPPASARPIPAAPSEAIPPPPPLPPHNAGPGAGLPPPPPPLPPQISSGGPPPPPMPPRAPGQAADPAPALPKASVPGRDGLLADIQKGARLKKVSDQEKRDRSAAMVPGTESAAAPPASSGGGGGDAQGGLAGALASALAARKSKVSHSDDEKDDDDW